MAITNTAVVNTTSKYIVQSKGIGDETDQILADGEKLKDGTNQSKLCLIECHYQIKGTGTLKLSAESEDDDLSLLHTCTQFCARAQFVIVRIVCDTKCNCCRLCR